MTPDHIIDALISFFGFSSEEATQKVQAFTTAHGQHALDTSTANIIALFD